MQYAHNMAWCVDATAESTQKRKKDLFGSELLAKCPQRLDLLWQRKAFLISTKRTTHRSGVILAQTWKHKIVQNKLFHWSQHRMKSTYLSPKDNPETETILLVSSYLEIDPSIPLIAHGRDDKAADKEWEDAVTFFSRESTKSHVCCIYNNRRHDTPVTMLASFFDIFYNAFGCIFQG